MDASDVADRLGHMAEAVCRHYLPKGKRSGNYWSVGDARGAPGRSLFVRLRTDNAGRLAGRWQDAATGEYGDLLDLIRETCSLRHFSDVLNEARQFLGCPGTDPCSHDTADSFDNAGAGHLRLFMDAQPLNGTLAEAYLRFRGITNFRHTRALRFQSRCRYRDDDGLTCELPALICGATDLAGTLTGINRTYLDPALGVTRLGKAPIETPRKGLGLIRGNAVRFGHPLDVMACGEGIETVLSLRTVAPDVPSAASLSASNLAALTLPQTLKRLYIVRDNDPAGRWATRRLADRANETGVDAIVLAPRLNDLNDDLRKCGVSELQLDIGRQLRADDRSAYLPRMLETL